MPNLSGGDVYFPLENGSQESVQVQPFKGKIGSERSKKCIGEEQASQLSQKVTAHILTGVGFEGATEVPLQVFSQLLSSKISKLGCILNVLASSYKGQCSAIKLFKMFFQVVGVSNIGSLAELVKDSTRTAIQHSQQQVHGMQSQQHSSLRLPQQVQTQRQMHQQIQQMIPPQNFVLQQMQHQQQLERMHRLQASSPRPGMDIDKDQAVLQRYRKSIGNANGSSPCYQ